jgi:hypothetical protein
MLTNFCRLKVTFKCNEEGDDDELEGVQHEDDDRFTYLSIEIMYLSIIFSMCV